MHYNTTCCKKHKTAMKKKILLTVLTIIFNANIFAQPCLANGIIFTNQTQIDSFQVNYPECSIIEGDVTIHGGSDITNLNGLSVLNSINGYLDIYENYSLTSLSGLDGLETIGGNLSLHSNTVLLSLSGLENLDSIGGWLVFFMNPNLNSLSGLENLLQIQGQLWIEYCHSLSNLNGLDNLTSIAGRLVIRHNPNLNSLSGLENLNSVDGYLEIWYNHELNSLVGLNGLNSINGDIFVTENDILTSLDGLENIDAGTIQDLSIRHNPQLSYCAVQSICDYLTAPNGTLTIEYNQTGCHNQQQVLDACESVSIRENTQDIVISIFPNPATDKLTITSNIEFKFKSVYIYNQLGQEVLHKKNNDENIDISTLGQGIYIVKLAINGLKIRQKLIIQ